MSLNKFSVLGLLIIAGCGQSAGTGLNNEVFGVATEQNRWAQLASLRPSESLQDLGALFEKTVPTNVEFGFNLSQLDDTAKETLRLQADFLKRFPIASFEIAGHTDAVGGETYNTSLGKRRADAVVAHLIELGIDEDRLDAVESFGETQLLVPTQEAERKNRRAVTRVAGSGRAFTGPGFDARRALEVYTGYVTGDGLELESDSSEIVSSGG